MNKYEHQSWAFCVIFENLGLWIQWWDSHPPSMSDDLMQTHGSCQSFGWSGTVALLKAYRAVPRQGQSEAETTAVPMLLLESSGTFQSQVNMWTAACSSFRELISLKIKYLLSAKTFKFQMLTGMIQVLCVFEKGNWTVFPSFQLSITFFRSSFSHNVLLFSDSLYNVTFPLRILVKVSL